MAALVVDNGSCMVKVCDARHHGRYGPEGQLCCDALVVDPAVAYLAGFAGDDIFAVFPSVVVGMLKMRCILVGMDLKDKSGMCKAGSARYVAPRVVFPLFVGRPARSWPRSRRRHWWQYTAGFACDDAHRVSLQVLGGAAGAVLVVMDVAVFTQ